MTKKYRTVDAVLKEHKKAIDDHSEKIQETLRDIKITKEFTFFFTVIVAITLVSTLIGLFGLYYTAYNNAQTKHEDDIERETLVQVLEELKKTNATANKSLEDVNNLKRKNPYLK